jgi:hypothetical protein
VAQGCGYVSTFAEDTPDGIKNALQSMIASAGPSLLEIRVNLHARKDLGRPTSTPVENKKSLMKSLHDEADRVDRRRQYHQAAGNYTSPFCSERVSGYRRGIV